MQKILKQKRSQRERGKLSDSEKLKLEKLYKKGPAAYGSVSNLQKASSLSRVKVETFLQSKNSHTKYRQYRRRFPRLKVIAYDINEIWSIDLAYVDKLANYNNGIKYLLVAVDVLSRKLRVQPMRTKGADETAKTFGRTITKTKPLKVWSDKGTEFKGAFKKFCESKGINTYTTNSEAKSAFAERNIRSLKNIIYKYLENKWSYRYINELQSFVNTINSRINRVTGLAPNKVSAKHVTNLVSQIAQQSSKLVRKPSLKPGDKVRIAKEDIPFKKGYKQRFTDEVFQITKIATFNPPTYLLVDSEGEDIQGKFYEPELTKTR